VSHPVIEVEDLSVGYQLYARPIDQLKELLIGGIRHDTFWALRDISLVVAEGERVGVVGPNGAGKSTLLKVIAGTMQPTSGRVATHGRISSLLSMVPAWNVEESGIENIRFNLLLNGIPEKRIPSMIEDIADFTELGPFLFHPVKTYSTGMGARLSFGIATASEPEILIIDEVLGTGDGYFAWKAKKRMEEFCGRGRAMILVSHSTAAIQSMCDRVVWMQNGSVRRDGPTNDVLSSYELDYRRAEDEALRSQHANRASTQSTAPTELTDTRHIRFRIVPKVKGPFFSSHYVSQLAVCIDDGPPHIAPLEFSDENGIVALDILNSEWARLHEKDGVACRGLARIAGRNSGGQFLVTRPNGDVRKISLDITLCSDDVREELQLEMLDMASGTWLSITEKARNATGKWQTVKATIQPSVISSVDIETIARAVNEAARPDAEIISVSVMADSEEVTSIVERQPFDIKVKVLFNHPRERIDVSLRLTRFDGVHAFWQSSGLDGGNISCVPGEKVFCFSFDPNCFGAGEYFITSHVTNGWDYPDNFPYSEIIARRLNAASFRIVPEMGIVNFGIVNQRVAVKIL
jgi:lipopolysaccharide transport system ATP-binding protein